MKTYIFKSTRKGKFSVNVPDDYKKISLPYFTEWVTALKSGKYNQCKNQLCKPLPNKKLGYCCLGVLSKIQGRLTKSLSKDYLDDSSLVNLDSTNPCFKILDSNGYLPDGCYVKKNDKKVCKLTNLNDTYGLSFKDIAKIIETVFKA